jgi:hypothetical protein
MFSIANVSLENLYSLQKFLNIVMNRAIKDRFIDEEVHEILYSNDLYKREAMRYKRILNEGFILKANWKRWGLSFQSIELQEFICCRAYINLLDKYHCKNTKKYSVMVDLNNEISYHILKYSLNLFK